MKLELEFKSVAKNGLPEKPGEYLVICHSKGEFDYYNLPCVTNFSAVHKKFNTFDEVNDEEFIEMTCFKDVVAYCELSEEDIEKIVREADNDCERDSGKN